MGILEIRAGGEAGGGLERDGGWFMCLSFGFEVFGSAGEG